MSDVSIVSETAPLEASSNQGDSASRLSTSSIRSSIYDYEQKHGRTYHAFRRGHYVIPNDEGELERMDLHYHALREIFYNRHWICPLQSPTHVLDVGTGTGIWAMDVADQHPNSQVTGIDLSPMQPYNVPPNVHFEVMDAQDDWDFNTRFDFIHTRLMNGFSIRSWPHFYQQAFQYTRPGGWVENQEFDLIFRSDDCTLPHHGALEDWAHYWDQGCQTMGAGSGRCYPAAMKRDMEAAGFVNVHIKSFKLPVGPWARGERLKLAGAYFAAGFLDGMCGLSLRVFIDGLGWKLKEMEMLLMQVREEVKSSRIHAYLPLYVVYGQRPLVTFSDVAPRI